jgi:DNA repair protein RecN (Recombination protein N)
LGAIEHSDERVAELEAALDAAESATRELASQISASRHQVAGSVESSVEEMLRRLGIPHARLVVEITPAPAPKADGADRVRFLFTANPSMTPRPIEKTASGGEISRVMLALKTLSARSAGMPTVVFDEIDAGVSGRVADAMGDIIAGLGRHCQVLNITHLPQIAAKEGTHFLVYKREGATRIRTLSSEERVAEIAGMLSGSSVTDAATRQARELLNAENNK